MLGLDDAEVTMLFVFAIAVSFVLVEPVMWLQQQLGFSPLPLAAGLVVVAYTVWLVRGEA